LKDGASFDTLKVSTWK